MWLRFFLEGCLDILVSFTLNMYYIVYHAEMHWEDNFNIANNIAIIVIGGVMLIFPFFIIIFYCRKFEKWQDEDFEEKYGSVFEGLKTTSRSSLFYQIVFVLRRFLLLFVAKVWKDLIFV